MAGLEVVTGLERLTIHQCEDFAQKLASSGPGKVFFDLCGPKGKKRAEWLDPWMGLLRLEGDKGFIMVSDLTYASDLWCENVRLGETPELRESP